MWNELHDLNERLARAADQQARIGKLQNRVHTLEAERRDLAARLQKLQQIAHQEEADVRRLEGLSLTGLFYSILGSRDEQLYRERQEALAAQLKVDEATQRLEAIERDLARARAEWQSALAPGEDYQSLLAQKAALIERAPGAAPELFRLGEREQNLQRQAKELREAYTAGINSDQALSQVEACLGSAQGWGTWDMLGGGMLATAMKHNRIDEARQHVHAAQQALAAFQRELKDVAMVIQVDPIQISGFATFADFFFDGLIADWIVQSRINQSLESARRSRGEVGHLLRILSQKAAQLQAEIAVIQQERQNFIANYQG